MTETPVRKNSIAELRWLVSAQAVSLLGTAISPLAIAFAVLDKLHSATDLGILLAVKTGVMTVFLIIGGVWADRLSRRTVMIASNVVCGATQVVFALVLMSQHPSLLGLCALQAVNAVATAFFRPASSGFTKEVVSPDQYQKANSLLSGANNLSSIVGPAVAGILIATVGASWGVFADGLSFLISAGLLVLINTRPRSESRQAAAEARSSVLREAREGLQVAIQQRWILLMIICFSTVQLLILAPYSVLGPIASESSYGGAGVWVLVTLLAGVGALAGDAVALKYSPGTPLRASTLMFIGTAPLLIALALHVPSPILLLLALVYGMTLSLPNVYWFTTLQRYVDDALIARVSSVDWMGSTVLRPIGLVVAAPMAVWLGVRTVLIGAASITVAVLLLLSLTRSLGHPGPVRAGEVSPELAQETEPAADGPTDVSDSLEV